MGSYYPPSRFSLTAPLAVWFSLTSWQTRRYFRSLFRPQSSPNLDTLRSSTPNLPDPPGGTNVTPPTNYDDPKAASTAANLTPLSLSSHDTGIAGSKPLQNADPTTGNSVTGVSYNLDSRNFTFTAPVLSLAGRAGLNLSLSLTYNSKILNSIGGVQVFNPDRGFPAPGWRIFGAIQGINSGGSIGSYLSSTTGKQSFLYIAADGTRHELAYNSTSGLYESYDSSYLDFNSSTKIMRTTDGTKITFNESATASGDYQFLPTQIKDRNGNFITITYKTLSTNDRVVDYVTDTLSRRIDFYYENNRLREIRQDRAGTLFKFVIINYEPVTISFSGATDPAGLNGTQVYLPTRITYPTGANFRFLYTGCGQIYQIEKWAPGVTGQGAARRIGYTAFNQQAGYPLGEGGSMTYRTEQAENWATATYSYFYNNTASGPAPYNLFHWVQEPGDYSDPGNPIPGRLFRLYHGSSLSRALATGDSSTTFKEQRVDYTQDSGVSYLSNPRVTLTKVSDGPYQLKYRQTTISYVQQHGVWLPNLSDETGSDYSVYPASIGTRRTETTYTHYPAQRIIGLPAQISVYDGAGTTLMTRTNFTYDETTTFTDSNGQVAPFFIDETPASVVQHDNTAFNGSFTARGNQTTVTQSSVVNGAVTGSRIIKRTAWDTNGNVRSVTDGAGNRSQMLYTDNFSNKPGTVGATQAYLYTAADPTGFRKGAQYNYWNGALLTSFNLTPGSSTQQQLVTTTYDFADRPLQTTRPDGGWVKSGYWDNLLYSGREYGSDRVQLQTLGRRGPGDPAGERSSERDCGQVFGPEIHLQQPRSAKGCLERDGDGRRLERD